MPSTPVPSKVADANPRIGVLLVNLGTPDAPTAEAVRRFLAEFLWDPRVVDAPRALWWLALHGVILRIRPRRSARAYAKIWTREGSPLLVLSVALAQAVRARLAARFGDGVLVDLAMRYGSPSLTDALDRLRLERVERVLVLPLFPQYSRTTTGSIVERVTAELARMRWQPDLRFVEDYHADEPYIAAVADSVSAHWTDHGKTHLLFSFHSIPQRYAAAGDPYPGQCQETARRVAATLGLDDTDWSLGYQSRFGREPWLEPYADGLLTRYAVSGPRRVSVVCPGFAVDCVETLEEVDLRYRARFLALGGERFDYVPALNAGDRHAALLEGLVVHRVHDWVEPPAREITAARSSPG
jgi:ferrochelatase